MKKWYNNIRAFFSKDLGSIFLSLIIGSTILFILILFNLHLWIIEHTPRFSKFMFSIFDWLNNITPNASFLSDIATIQGVLIGIAIPLSLQVTLKNNEKYGDPEISDFFLKEPLYKKQYAMLLINILIAVLFRMLNILPIVIMFFLFLWFTINIFNFRKFIKLVEEYAVNTDTVILGKLRKIIDKIISLNKVKKIDDFYFIMEKVTNITISKIKLRQNKRAENAIKQLIINFDKLWDLKNESKDKFEELLKSKKAYKKIESMVEQDMDEQETGIEDISNRMVLNTYTNNEANDISRSIFSSFFYTFEIIWDTANIEKNFNISKSIVYNLNITLARFASQDENSNFTEGLLDTIKSISRKAVFRHDKMKENDPSIYAATYQWYTDIIYNQLDRRIFDIKYLQSFNNTFFEVIKYTISTDKNQIFNEIVSTLIDGIHIPSNEISKLWQYDHLLAISDSTKYYEIDAEYNLISKVSKLSDQENKINTLEKLTKWLESFNEIKSIIKPHFDNQTLEKGELLNSEITKHVNLRYKYHTLIELIFGIGAYCVFKKQYSFIRYLWEYKQPNDSEGIWLGHDLIPKDLGGLVDFYLTESGIVKFYDFWEDHHDSKKYYDIYFVLNIMNKLKKENENIEAYFLPNIGIHKLREFEHKIPNFIKIAQEIIHNITLIEILGFDKETISKLCEDRVIGFFNKLKGQAQNKIENENRMKRIDATKIKRFRNEVLKGFYESAKLRDIFNKFLNRYELLEFPKASEKDIRSSINRIDDKAIFFNDWYISYLGWGENYGREFANWENKYIIDLINNKCDLLDIKDFKSKLNEEEIKENLIIFSGDSCLWQYFQKDNNFIPKWSQNANPLDLIGFSGWYKHKGTDIPIFSSSNLKTNQFLLVDKTRIGSLIQLNPLKEGESESLKEGIFIMNIEAYSENEKLLEEIIAKPPDWLKEYGDKDKQTEYLMSKVRIQIYYRFKLEIEEENVGYSFITDDL